MAAAKKMTLVDDAYDRLKKEILENRMPPGFQAPEPEIAHRFGMSRTPIREASLKLESEGLVELIPRRGLRVLPVSPVDMKEIYEIFTALEPEVAANLAAAKLRPAQLDELETATSDMEKALEQQDLDAWAEADNHFHRKMLALHGNKRLSNFLRILSDQAHRVRIMTLRLREIPSRSTREHREILNCIRQYDSEGARQTFRKHRERTSKELLAILEKYNFSSL